MILTNAAIFLGQYDVSGYLNKVALKLRAPGVDDTRFGHTTKVAAAGGVRMHSGSFGGFADPAAAGMEAIADSKFGLANIPFAVIPGGGSVGDVARFFKAFKGECEVFGKHGENMPYAGTVEGGDDGRPCVRGTVFLAKAARTVSVNSAITQIGAVTAARRVYAALHVFSKTGTPTLDVVLKSAATGGFGSPTTRSTFAQATDATSEIVSAAGAITDEFWRVDCTIGGGSPNITFAVLVGIAGA